MLGEQEINNRFGFHSATVEGPNATGPMHTELRRKFVEFANMLDAALPDSRAKSVAMTELESASMWAHKSVASLAPTDKI
jgi:hypothetical protein